MGKLQPKTMKEFRMKFGDLEFYREPYMINSRRLTKTKLVTTVIKTALLMLQPAIPVFIACTIWYLVLYQNHIHFHKEVKEYWVAYFMPSVTLIYSVTSGWFISKVLEEYKGVRMAIKRYDIHTFMHLRDEDVSPLAHALMTILAIFIIGGAMGLEYPTPWSGVLLIGSTTYIFSFIFCLIREIDNPFEGIWFIKNIHPEWMEIDCRQWREEHYMRERRKRLTHDKSVSTSSEEEGAGE